VKTGQKADTLYKRHDKGWTAEAVITGKTMKKTIIPKQWSFLTLPDVDYDSLETKYRSDRIANVAGRQTESRPDWLIRHATELLAALRDKCMSYEDPPEILQRLSERWSAVRT
jgi:hypothetical protein